MKIKTIHHENLIKDKRILMRVDFNVPMVGKKIKDDYKLVANLPEIKRLIKQKATVILVSHLGEPEFSAGGKLKNKNLSLAPMAPALAKLLKRPVVFCDQPIGSKQLKAQIAKLKPGQIALLENIRFYQEETKNNKAFAKKLTSLGDVYINNAFSVSHRDHASVSAIKKYLPSYAGGLVEEEILALARVLNPKKPFIAVLGGAKIDTKTALLKKLSTKADFILVGGAIANNFLASRGLPIGKSLANKEGIKLAKKIDNKKIILPVDVIVTDKNYQNLQVKKVAKVSAKDYIYDIGPETMKLYAKYLKTAQTLFWNGPMGLFEQIRLRQGTLFVGRVLAQHAKGKAYGVVGGGETIEALHLTGMADFIDWTSTGGGASLAYLSGEKLPGLKGLVK